MVKTLAQIVYEAYIATGSYPVSEYPLWGSLVPHDQQRWEAVAQAVADAAMEEYNREFDNPEDSLGYKG